MISWRRAGIVNTWGSVTSSWSSIGPRVLRLFPSQITAKQPHARIINCSTTIKINSDFTSSISYYPIQIIPKIIDDQKESTSLKVKIKEKPSFPKNFKLNSDFKLSLNLFLHFQYQHARVVYDWTRIIISISCWLNNTDLKSSEFLHLKKFIFRGSNKTWKDRQVYVLKWTTNTRIRKIFHWKSQKCVCKFRDSVTAREIKLCCSQYLHYCNQRVYTICD